MKDNLSEFQLDLGTLLTKEELARLAQATTQQKKLKAKIEPKAKPEPAAPTPYRPRWDAVCAVLVLQRITCSCGQQFITPAARTPLVRFQHRTIPDAIDEQAYHPGLINESLPRELRYLDVSVSACPECFHKKPALAENLWDEDAQSMVNYDPSIELIEAINAGAFEETCL